MGDWPEELEIKPLDQWHGERTVEPRYSPFRVRGMGDTMDVLTRELKQIGAERVILLVDIDRSRFRKDGRPAVGAVARSAGVILEIGDSEVGHLRFPCDTFHRWEDNLRGIALSMEALRKVDRYGVTKRAEQYTGWKELTGGRQGLPTMSREEAWEAVCENAGLPYVPYADLTDYKRREIAKMAKKAAHPDQHGGNEDFWNQVDNALQIIKEHNAKDVKAVTA